MQYAENTCGHDKSFSCAKIEPGASYLAILVQFKHLLMASTGRGVRGCDIRIMSIKTKKRKRKLKS